MQHSRLIAAHEHVDDARRKFATVKAEWLDTKALASNAKNAADRIRYERGAALSRGGPRRAPGTTAPMSEAEIQEVAANKIFDSADLALHDATRAVTNAEAHLLNVENGILGSHRDALAREILELRRTGRDPQLHDSKVAALRNMCPHVTHTRLNQRFPLSAVARDALGDDTRVMIDVPVHELRGAASVDYETRRAEILEVATDDTATAEVA